MCHRPARLNIVNLWHREMVISARNIKPADKRVMRNNIIENEEYWHIFSSRALARQSAPPIACIASAAASSANACQLLKANCLAAVTPVRGVLQTSPMLDMALTEMALACIRLVK